MHTSLNGPLAGTIPCCKGIWESKYFSLPIFCSEKWLRRKGDLKWLLVYSRNRTFPYLITNQYFQILQVITVNDSSIILVSKDLNPWLLTSSGLPSCDSVLLCSAHIY
jgi:hypothetical protein